jgi:bifunctional DNA-binding transcriptional regulator/antitoxin component of YhaV-PrlF toxin-antitoxin module
VPTDPLPLTFPVHLDSKRRPTLPARLLDEAGISGASDLVARVDGPGRIVLEDPEAMLRALQEKLAGSLRDAGERPAVVVDALLADRAAEAHLEA